MHFLSLHYQTICIRSTRKVGGGLNINSIFFIVCNKIHSYFHIYIRNGTMKYENSIRRDTIICTVMLKNLCVQSRCSNSLNLLFGSFLVYFCNTNIYISCIKSTYEYIKSFRNIITMHKSPKIII